MLAAFATIFVVFASVTAIALAARTFGGPLDVAPPTPPERVPFAGGIPPQTHAWNRFHVRYYVMALLFLTFDMEMVYMFPWAVVFLREGVIAVVEIFVFISILALGILYAWRERSIGWA